MSNEISYRECPFCIVIENQDVLHILNIPLKLSGRTVIEHDTLYLASKNINGIISFDLKQYLISGL